MKKIRVILLALLLMVSLTFTNMYNANANELEEGITEEILLTEETDKEDEPSFTTGESLTDGEVTVIEPDTELGSDNVDGDPADLSDHFTGTPADDGKVVTDKTVSDTEQEYVVGDGTEVITPDKDNFIIELSALAQAWTEMENNDVDVVFIVDKSGSMAYRMDGKSDGTTDMTLLTHETRMEATIKALNAAIAALYEGNPDTRIAVVTFSGTTVDHNVDIYADAIQILLPLGKYTAAPVVIDNGDGTTTIDTTQYFTTSKETITVTESQYGYTYDRNYAFVYVDRNVRDADGNEITNLPSTGTRIGGNTFQYEMPNRIVAIGGTYTQGGIAAGARILNQATDIENRTPIMVLLADGGANYYYEATRINNIPTTTANSGVKGNGSSYTNDCLRYTINTAIQAKEVLTTKYNKTAAIYTVGLGAFEEYEIAILNPTLTNLRNYNRNLTGITGMNSSDYKSYSDSNDKFIGTFTTDTLTTAFTEIAGDIIFKFGMPTKITLSNDLDGSLVITDVIGKGMEVKEFYGIFYMNEYYQGQLFTSLMRKHQLGTLTAEEMVVYNLLMNAIKSRFGVNAYFEIEALTNPEITYTNKVIAYAIKNADGTYTYLTTAPTANKDYNTKVETYIFVGGSNPNTAVYSEDYPGMSAISIMIYKPTDDSNEVVQVIIPGEIVPVVTYNSSEINQNKWTMRFVYEVGLKDDVDVKTAGEVIGKDKDGNNVYAIYTNAWDSETGKALSTAHFIPSEGNPYYKGVLEDTKLYVKDANGNLVPATGEFDRNLTYYKRFANLAGTKYEYGIMELSFDDTKVTKDQNGELYIASTAAYVGINLLKENNISNTSETAYSSYLEDGAVTIVLGNNGTLLLNGNTLTVNKVWYDEGSKENDSVTVGLYEVTEVDGKRVETLVETVTINRATGIQTGKVGYNNTYTWYDLNLQPNQTTIYVVYELDANGNKVPNGNTIAINGKTYTVSYKEDANAIVITNSLLGDIVVNKVWDDTNNQDNIRPNSITVTLYRNDVEYDEDRIITVDKDGKISYTWKNQDMYNTSGIAYIYKVIEKAIKDYTTTYESINKESKLTDGTFGDSKVVTITNSHDLDTTNLVVNKVWDDTNNQDNIRPNSITVTLYRDDVEYDKDRVITVDKDGKISYTWEDLTVNKGNGVAYIYKVIEKAIKDYTTTYESINKESKLTDGTFGDSKVVTITNSHENYQIELDVNKTWYDEGAKENDSITVGLFDGDNLLKTVTIYRGNGTPDENTGYNNTFTFTGFDLNRNGQAIDYEIYELNSLGEKLLNGNKIVINSKTYEVSYDDNEIINTLLEDLILDKVWVDNNDEDSIRPDSITVTLLRNDEILENNVVIEKDEKGNINYIWEELPMYDELGIRYIYKVVEEQINNYLVSYSSNSGEIILTDGTFGDSNSITLTNTKTVGSITITKVVTGRGDTNREFTFIIEFTDLPADVELPVVYSNGTTGTLANDGTFKLKHGESITIYSLPIGTSYKITEIEANKNDYVTTSTYAEGEVGMARMVSTFTNHLGDLPPKTGDNMIIYFALGIVSTISLLGMIILRKKYI